MDAAGPIASPDARARGPRLTLRARLIVLVSLLTAAGLLVAGVVTYVSLRDFLLERVDEQLRGSRVPVAIALAMPGDTHDLPDPTTQDPGGGPREMLPPGTYGELRAGNGATVLDTVAFTYGGEAPSPPDLPDDVSAMASGSMEPGATDDVRPATVAARGGDGPDYRVLVTHVPAFDRHVVVAVPLDEVSDTLTRLLTIEAVVSLVVLGVLGLTTWALVRRELRPLEAMAADADAIASGDLSRRITRSDTRTEVGRLGTALNAMLAQIERALAESRASEERLRRFLADASHELRTPLTSIRGYAELFHRGAGRDADDLALAMRRIEEEGGRMGVIVDDLLLLARLDQGRPLQRDPVDLVTLAEDAVADARAADPDREVSLVAPDDCVVTGDEARLRQALANLLSNALTHTPPGSPVRVSVTGPDAEGAGAGSTGDDVTGGADPDRGSAGAWAVLTVTDTGPGIAAGDLDRVFEPFHRGRDAADDESGAGLGLAIVAAIAAAHGGTIDADNGPSGGATLTLRLPLSSSDDQTVGASADAPTGVGFEDAGAGSGHESPGART